MLKKGNHFPKYADKAGCPIPSYRHYYFYIILRTALLFIFCFPGTLLAQTIQSNKAASSLETMLFSKYGLGRNIRLTYTKRVKQHVWLVGIGIPALGSGDKYSNTNDITSNNGYAGQFSDYIHPLFGYRRHINLSEIAYLYGFVELTGGTIHLGNRFYGHGLDSIGNPIGIAQHVPEPSIKKGMFLQISAGFGLEIKLFKRLNMINQLGFGESFARYSYASGYGFNYLESSVDHFVFCYGLGFSYRIK